MLRALFHRFVELRRQPPDELHWSPSGWSQGVSAEPVTELETKPTRDAEPTKEPLRKAA